MVLSVHNRARKPAALWGYYRRQTDAVVHGGTARMQWSREQRARAFHFQVRYRPVRPGTTLESSGAPYAEIEGGQREEHVMQRYGSILRRGGRRARRECSRPRYASGVAYVSSQYQHNAA